LPTSIVAATVLDFGSSRATLFFGAFETQTCSSTASQSGLPPTSKTASGSSFSIGMRTSGELTPGFFCGCAS